MVSQTPISLATWQIDPTHTHVEFAVRHMMVTTVKGRFTGMSGRIKADGDEWATASVEASIDAASIDTRESQRDAHLRSADFLDVERFPTVTFESRHIERKGKGEYKVHGDLAIRGVTREVVLDATFEGRAKDPWGGERVGFSASTKIDRRDYGLTWNVALEAGGILVGDQVKISLEVEAVRQA